MDNESTTLVVRLNVTVDFLKAWKSGQAAHIEEQARQQAERAAKVRYMGCNDIRVEKTDVKEIWLVDDGKTIFSLDFIFQVTAR